MAVAPSGHTLLGIYLNDHLAGAVAGAGLAARLAEAERDRDPGRRSNGWRGRSRRTG